MKSALAILATMIVLFTVTIAPALAEHELATDYAQLNEAREVWRQKVDSRKGFGAFAYCVDEGARKVIRIAYCAGVPTQDGAYDRAVKMLNSTRGRKCASSPDVETRIGR